MPGVMTMVLAIRTGVSLRPALAALLPYHLHGTRNDSASAA